MVHRLRELAVIRPRRGEERGAMMVFSVIVMTTLLGFVALTVDLGNATQKRRQAKNASDLSALAGAQRIEDYGADFTGTTLQWGTVVSDIKNYAFQNYGVPIGDWVGCSDSAALTYRPDTTNENTCISADIAGWPSPQVNSSNLSNRIRVKLPPKSLANLFAGAIGGDSLTVNATSMAVVTRTKTTITKTVTSTQAGGPCAICVLADDGLAFDGQNGDITVNGGDVVVNSTASIGASLNPNGHVRVINGDLIGGPDAPGNFYGSGFSPSPTQHDPITDPLAHVPACDASTCPTTARMANTTTLQPGVYSSISGSHTLSPGLYVVKEGGITLNGNDVLRGSGVMIYLACKNYPSPCNEGEDYPNMAQIKATGNGALQLTPPTEAQCQADASICPYVGLTIFADRFNRQQQTFRGNGTNESGGASGSSGTIYLRRGTLDLRGNGYTLASMIVVHRITMEGNPSAVTVAYDLDQNVPTTHTVITTTTEDAYSYDNGGLIA